jgi:hypothetical protein
MLIKDLVVLLLAQNPNAQAFFMTQRKQPFENHIAGIVARWQMVDQDGRDEPGIAEDDVFLTVGKRIRPGSLSAWLLAERAEREAANLQSVDEPDSRDATLATIAREHLDVESLNPSGSSEDDIQHLKRQDLHNALLAAYHAGVAKGLRHLRLPASADHHEG